MNHAVEAAKAVLGDRNDDYGDPRPDFEGLAKVWSGLLIEKLKRDLTAEEVALMLVGLKIKRLAHKHKADSVTDAHGYLLTYAWVQSGKQPEQLEIVCTAPPAFVDQGEPGPGVA
ncbi:MAG TPA: DUF6378 domain-containing protein [Candidatus Synoicihabitans sp.]|nr:DUF6378 domain-containing protein [Candidatus Synoicihabitans sp.]